MPSPPPQSTPGPRPIRHFRTPPGESESLSALECAVLELSAQGRQYHEIACDLGYADSTVKNAFYRAFKKLGAHTMTEAVMIAMDTGAISPLLRRPDRPEPQE